jgi:hypothetical protein
MSKKSAMMMAQRTSRGNCTIGPCAKTPTVAASDNVAPGGVGRWNPSAKPSRGIGLRMLVLFGAFYPLLTRPAIAWVA